MQKKIDIKIPEPKTKNVNIRISKSQYIFIKKNNISPTKVFNLFLNSCYQKGHNVKGDNVKSDIKYLKSYFLPLIKSAKSDDQIIAILNELSIVAYGDGYSDRLLELLESENI